MDNAVRGALRCCLGLLVQDRCGWGRLWCSLVAWGRWFKTVVDKSVCGALSSPGFVASDPLWVKPFVVLSLPGVVGSEPLWIERFVVLSLVA